MAQITKKTGPKGLLVTISGPIDDRDDFAKEIGQFHGSLTLYCEGVTRINSIGVKKWMTYTQSMELKGVEIFYESISPALVEQFNQVKNFGGKSTVQSLVLPYRCNPCDHNFQITELVKNIRALAAIPTAKCPQCGKQAELDELPEEYCAFILKQG